jgi:hypothetical protein
MRKKTLKTIIAFYTTADAMETEFIMKANGISGRLIPVPREISAGCGFAWSMEPSDYMKIPKAVLDELPTPEQKVELMI